MSESAKNRALGVFAKQPLPGAAKTRLAEDTSPGFAARVAEAMLLDSLRRLSRIEARRILAFAPAHARASFELWAAGAYSLSAQVAGDLGTRMLGFFQEQLAQTESVVLVGTDSPTLPLEYVERAFAALASADVVLGPATDGGFYLIGCRRPVPEAIFRGVDWGDYLVLGQTVERLPAERTLELLPPWYDVDTLRDLAITKNHYHALRRAGAEIELPHLSALLNW